MPGFTPLPPVFGPMFFELPHTKETIAFIKMQVAVAENAAVLIGAYFYKKYFNESIEEVQSKSRYKMMTFNALCEHPDLKDLSLNRSKLYRMVRVAAQNIMLTEAGIATSKLNFTQHVILSPLIHDDRKLDLVRECISQKYTCDALATRIKTLQLEPPEAERKPVFKRACKLVKKIAGTITVPEELSDLEALEDMPDKDRLPFCENIDKAIVQLYALKTALFLAAERVRKGLGE